MPIYPAHGEGRDISCPICSTGWLFDVVQLPPLRERQSDIMLMAEHFAIQMCRELRLPLFSRFLPIGQKETLLHYAWPGNVRELKNVVERSVYRHGSSEQPLDEIVIDPFQRHPAEPPAPRPASGIRHA
ncbi:transcriptional regulator [Salmonella enterica subsp. enterica]|uniref:Transcriptional regulator n=1 Tax=Salmonella enterica I TaxID=59201 RepID=A0A3S4JER0_SALET|nr:transcriptional regulator [Salmonella enterica subsp. enterica]